MLDTRRIAEGLLPEEIEGIHTFWTPPMPLLRSFHICKMAESHKKFHCLRRTKRPEYLHSNLLSPLLSRMTILIPSVAAFNIFYLVALVQAAPLSTSSIDPLQLTSFARRSSSPFQLALAVDFPDPSIIQYNNTFYAFATTNGINTNVQIASKSSTSSTWSLWSGFDALPIVGSWSLGQISYNGWSDHQVWAPNVIQNDSGLFVMYYSASLTIAPRFHCTGVATSSTIEGPYTPSGSNPLLCPVSQGGAIDASGFQDVDGSRWIVYKIDGNSLGNGGVCGNTVPPIQPTSIMLQRVDGDGITIRGTAIKLLDRQDSDGPLIEAPALVRAPGGWYVLFFSSGCYDSDLYDVGYAIGMNVTGKS